MEGMTLSYRFIPNLRVIGFQVIKPDFYFGLAVDSFDYRKMKYIGIDMGYSWRF
jgi:hypothetical protein